MDYAASLADISRKQLRQAGAFFRAYQSQIKLAGLVIGGIFTALLFFVVGAIIRVLIGPVSLGPFNEQVKHAISDSLPGLAVGYDQAAVQWSPDEHRINLVVLGARVLDGQQRIIAQAPKAEVDLAAGPFLHGKVEVQRIALVGMQLTLVRKKDGSLRLGVERDVTDNDVLDRIREAISKAKGGPATLESFAVKKARLAFLDEATGAFLVSPNANFQISTGDKTASQKDKLEMAVDADVEISGKPAHLIANLKLPSKAGTVTGDISFTGLDLKALGTNARAFVFLKPFALKADVTGSFVFDNGTRLRYADLGIGASGVVNGFGVPLNVRMLKLVARYDGLTGRLLVDDASLESDHARAHITGQGQLDFDATNALTKAELNLTADQLAVDMPGVVKQSVTLGRVVMNTVYTTADQKVVIDKLTISGGAMNAQMKAAITLTEKHSPAIQLDGTIAEMPVRDFLHYWPLHMGEGAREWINDNITAGRIGPIAVHADIKQGALDLPSLPDEALNLSVPLKAATVIYVRSMSPMTNVQGVATLLGDSFKATIASGVVGPVTMSNGTVAIPQLHQHGTIGVINTRIAGTTADILRLIDQKPLQYPTRFHISPKSAGGTAVADLTVKVPMLRGLSTDNIGIMAKVATTQFSLTLGSSTHLSNGTLNFEIGNDRLHAAGTVGIGGAPLNVDWVEDFKTKADTTTTIVAKGLMDEATRTALHINTGDLVVGPVMVNAQVLGHRGNLRRANIAMDLTPTNIGLDIANFHKPPGTAATAQMGVVFGNDSDMKSATLAVSGPTLNGHGTLTFGQNSELARLDFADLRAGPVNDFALSYAETAAGGLDVTVRGREGDGTGLGHRNAAQANAQSASEPTDNEPFRISVRLDRVVLRDNVAISNFALDTAGTGNRPQTMSLSGMIGKGRIAGSIAPSDIGRRVSLTTDDAGDLFKGIFGFSSMRGGNMTINATLSPAATAKNRQQLDYAGTVTIKDFKITDQPFLARLFAAGSLVGIGDLMSNEGITFRTLEVPFRAQNDAITIHEARAAGPAVGITADGYLDRANDKIALKGTLAPAYGINSLLGSIPLLGAVLVSKQGEGIIGVTYSVSGNTEQPNLSVNPLSALAPGIFRRIFQGAMPVAPQNQPQASTILPPADAPPKLQ